MSFTEYYQLLSSLSNWVSLPLSNLSSQLNFALATALILGVIGAASPCQLSTNVSALLFFTGRVQEGRRLFGSALAYFLGKAAVYTILAAVIIALGLELSRIPTEVAVAFRRLLGPLLVAMGLLLLGWARINLLLGGHWQRRLEGMARGSGRWSGFWLGVAFSFVFCPTLFLLFFGFLVPLSTTTPLGITFPGLFALGTTLPLHFLVLMLALSSRPIGDFVRGLRSANLWLRRVVGLILLLLGLNEIFLYWVLG